MKVNIVIRHLTILLFFSAYGCATFPIPPMGSDEENSGRLELTTRTAEPKKVTGGEYPQELIDPNLKLNEPTKPYIVPDGPLRGKLEPLNKSSKLDKIGGTNQAVSFEEYDEINDSPQTSGGFPEPSVAANGNTVMMTGNWFISLSLDGGQSFNSVSPTTIFPQDYGGFCCDQVLHYVPKYDLFVWLLQYRPNGSGTNAIRIAVQSTEEVRSSNGTSWTYWDFTNTTFSSGGPLDYNDVSVGDSFLYWCSSIIGEDRHVIRVPLSQLAARSTVNFQFTGTTDAFWSHVTQNGSDGVYWAGHENNSTMKVYSMMDGDNFYSWRNVAINSWPNNTMTSTAADGNDWLLDANWKTYVRAAAVSGNKIYFAWNAGTNDRFPEPHIQIVEINRNNFRLTKQMQVWNPDFAFAYPYFDINDKEEIGMITAFGGGLYNASSGVGVWGDFVIYYPQLSDRSTNNYGHYHTVRTTGREGLEWAASGYTYGGANTIIPYYVRFRH